MTYKASIPGVFLLLLSVASAQVASHAPTGVHPGPVQAPADINKPVVSVNGALLTNADLTREEYAIFPYARQHGGLPKDLAPQIRDGAMKMIIFEELVYQEAQRRKMTIPAEKLQRAETDFRKQFSNPQEFNALMQSEFHGSRAQLREKIRRSLLIDALLKAEVENKSVVTPAEVRSFYDKNSTQFTHPETYTIQTITIIPPAKANADQLKEARTRAEKALAQARTTKNAEEFGLLAEKLSDDDYRVMMGQHKPLAVSELAPPVFKALTAMHPGEVSGLLQVDQIYTIVRYEVHEPAGKTPFADVKKQLENQVHQIKRNQLRSDFDKKLHEHARIQFM